MNGAPHDLVADIYAAMRDVLPDVDPASLDPSAAVVELLDLDSIQYATFLEAVGDRVGVDLSEDALDRVRSIDDIVAYVVERAGPRRGVGCA